ncbi:MAG: hypothetical protein JXR13_01005 [Thalassovita sp.]
MFALFRLLTLGFVVLTVIYFAVSLWSRMTRRRKLGQEWDDDIKTGDRDAFIRDGLKEYDHSLRRKLILMVYVVPVTVVGLIIYFVNFY